MGHLGAHKVIQGARGKFKNFPGPSHCLAMGEGSYLHNLKRKRKQEECEECEEVIAPETGAGSLLSAPAGGEEMHTLTSLANKNFLAPSPKKRAELSKESVQEGRSFSGRRQRIWSIQDNPDALSHGLGR